MALSINTNIASLQAQNNLSKVNQALEQNQERLSSGLRINSAADDAAGLAISDRMTAQIKGMNQASSNAQDGISLAQTAEGGLKEITNIIQRMRELSVQAANDTNTASDRESIQTEVDQLVNEMDRISSSTQFNGESVLNGSFNGEFQVGANSGQRISFSISAAGAGDVGQIATATGSSTVSSNPIDQSGNVVKINGEKIASTSDLVSGDNGKDADSALAKAKAINQTSGISVTAEAQTTTSTLDTTNLDTNNQFEADDEFSINGTMILDGTQTSTKTSQEVTDLINSHSAATGVTAQFDSGADEIKLSADDGRNITWGDTAGTNSSTLDKGTQQGKIKLEDTENINIQSAGTNIGFSVGSIATDNKGVNDIDVTSVSGASTAINRLDSALSSIDNIKSNLGAVQNRFESVISNLDNTTQNLTEARSRIQDADIAKEAAEQTQNNVRRQAAAAVLTQANQSPQLALQLLGG